MNVRELLEVLEDLDPDLEVVLSCDSEGNNYSPLAAYSDEGRYVPEYGHSGYLWYAEDDEHLDCDHDEDDTEGCTPEPPEDAVPCIALWPTN